MFAKSAALIGMASMASAHIIMTNPVPYGSPNSSPLLEDGSDFPCKGASPSGSAGNTFEAGSTQQLSFMGSAVHGGGSCQVSVTTDKNPDKNSSWKVIKSIEGGCPAKNTEGNRPENPDDTSGDTYDFTVPSKLAEGEYVFAWTWFNKIGNREMYMNCASVQVTGGSGDESYLESLPDMFVANIGNGCVTEESYDVQFGTNGDTDKFNGATDAFKAPGPECTQGSPGNPGEPEEPEDPQPSPPVGGEPTQPPQNPEPTQPPQNPEPTPEPTPSVPGGVFPPAPTGGNPPPEGGEGAQTPGSPCEEGAWNCVGGSSFQRCGSGVWSVVMPLSGGMTCNPGTGPELQAHAIRAPKSMRRRALPIKV